MFEGLCGPFLFVFVRYDCISLCCEPPLAVRGCIEAEKINAEII